LRTFIALLAIAAGAQAQTSSHARTRPAASEPKGAFPLISITVEGNRTHAERDILSIAGLRTGHDVTKADFEAARQRLLNTGYFQTISYSYGPAPNSSGYALKLELVEEPQLYQVLFMDLPASDADLRALLKKNDPLFTGRAPATDPIVKHYTQLIADYLASAKNYHDRITGALSPENPPDLALVFRPALQATIAEVKFIGNRSVDTTALLNAVAGVAIGTVYSEGRFRESLDLSVRPLYEAQGRLRVAFPKISLEKAPDVKGEIATVQIEEGPVYNLSGVRAPGNPELVKLAGLKIGQPVNFDQVQKAKERIRDSYKRHGFLDPTVNVARDIDDTGKTVVLSLTVTAGDQYRFGSLDIRGLDLVSEPEVRKMWGLKPGAPFVSGYPDQFLTAVRDEGVFENLGETRAEQKLNADTHTVDVTLYFKGAPPKDERHRRRPDDTTSPADPSINLPLTRF
jgi:outer membrane protein insertion porin family